MAMEKDAMQGRVWAIKNLKSNKQDLKLNSDVQTLWQDCILEK